MAGGRILCPAATRSQLRSECSGRKRFIKPFSPMFTKQINCRLKFVRIPWQDDGITVAEMP
jgi:hypothetical protein